VHADEHAKLHGGEGGAEVGDGASSSSDNAWGGVVVMPVRRGRRASVDRSGVAEGDATRRALAGIEMPGTMADVDVSTMSRGT